jgi:hypothetical protein
MNIYRALKLMLVIATSRVPVSCKSYINEYEKFRPLLTDLLKEDQKLFDFLSEHDGIFYNKI